MSDFEPAPDGLSVALGCLSQDTLGDVELEVFATGLPPVLGDLLMSGDDDVATLTAGQVADEGGFEVDLGFHGSLALRF